MKYLGLVYFEPRTFGGLSVSEGRTPLHTNHSLMMRNCAEAGTTSFPVRSSW